MHTVGHTVQIEPHGSLSNDPQHYRKDILWDTTCTHI